MKAEGESFADELDELVTKWRKKPLDDVLSYGEVMGALIFKIYTLCREVDEQYRADND